MSLYLFSITLLFLVVAAISNWSINDSSHDLIRNSAKWISFTILGYPDLNGVERTSTIVAGVTWTLSYEWLFCFFLPLLALTVGSKPSVPFLVIGVVGAIGFSIKPAVLPQLLSFGSGITAAILVRFGRFRQLASGRTPSIVVIISIGVAVMMFRSAYSPVPFFLLSLSFALVAAGNTLFGALSSSISRTLGEMAYSIYLLHGLALFTVFNFLVGWQNAKALSPAMHWLLITIMTPGLVAICFLTFRLIERPAMKHVANVTSWIRHASDKRDTAKNQI